MESYNFTLQPVFVSNVHFEASAPAKRDQNMHDSQVITIQDISKPKSDIHRAMIKCDMSIQRGEGEDLAYLDLTAYAVLECQIRDDGVDFNELVQVKGLPRFMNQFRETAAKVTQDLFGMEILDRD